MAHTKTRARSSSLFLLELIIAIVFFAAASAVCVQLFVKSHSLSVDSQQLNAMVNEASAAAEIVYKSGNMQDAVSALSSYHNDYEKSSSDKGESVQWFYDSRFNPCSSDNASYVISIELNQKEYLLNADIVCTEPDGREPIFSQPIKHAVTGSTTDHNEKEAE